MEASAALTFIFLAAALMLSIIGALFNERRLLKTLDQELTFVLETLALAVDQLERIRAWIRELQLEAEKKESRG